MVEKDEAGGAEARTAILTRDRRVRWSGRSKLNITSTLRFSRFTILGN
jgi:hypothetical protein